MIRCLIFDLGNVVVRFSHKKASLQLANVLQTTQKKVEQFLFTDKMHHDFESGKISTTELMNRLRSHFNVDSTDEQIAEAFNNIFELVDGIETVFKSAKKQGLRIVALSNTNPLNALYIEEKWKSVFDLFDAKTYSYKIGAMKPLPSIYESAISQSGFSASECFYTDDIQEYVDAGITHGLNAAVFTDVKKYKKDLKKHDIIF